jgi:hypothetical protein
MLLTQVKNQARSVVFTLSTTSTNHNVSVGQKNMTKVTSIPIPPTRSRRWRHRGPARSRWSPYYGPARPGVTVTIRLGVDCKAASHGVPGREPGRGCNSVVADSDLPPRFLPDHRDCEGPARAAIVRRTAASPGAGAGVTVTPPPPAAWAGPQAGSDGIMIQS